MKKFVSLLMVCVLSCGLIAGCGGGKKGGDTGGEKDAAGTPKTARSSARGRYVEEVIPIGDDTGFPNEMFVKDGKLVFFSMAFGKDSGGNEKMSYTRNVYNGGRVETSDLEPVNALNADGSIQFFGGVSESPNGALTVLYQELTGNYRVARAEKGEPLTAVDLEGYDEEMVSSGSFDGSSLNPMGVISLDDSFFVLYSDQLRRYDNAGKELSRYLSEFPVTGSAVHGDNLAVFTDSRKKIEVYSLSSGDKLYTVPFDQLNKNTAAPGTMAMDAYNLTLGLDSKGVFIATPMGVYRWSGSSWELLDDIGLSTLMMPDKAVIRLISDDNGGFYANLDGRELSYFFFDKDIPLPSQELEVYSLYNNATIRKAIGEFQKKNPDVRVNLRIAMSEMSGATVEDVIRALNTELIAGKGPDILVLDGLPVKAYIEKDVLKDITSLANDYVNKHGLMENFTQAYTLDGKVFGIPARFTLPVMTGVKEYVDKIDSLKTLADMVDRLQGGEIPFLFPSEAFYSPLGVVMDYYGPFEDEMISGREVNEAALAEYYANALRINNALTEHTPMDAARFSMTVSAGTGVEVISSGVNNLVENTALVDAHTIMGTMGIYYIAFYFMDRDDMTVESIFNSNKYNPVGGVGITTTGTNQALAELFLESLFTREIQDIYLYDGFPVNGKSMNEMLAELEETVKKGEESMGVTNPKEDRFMGFMSVYNNLSTAIISDSVIRAAVEARVPALLDGSITPEQAAAQVVNNIRMYLAE